MEVKDDSENDICWFQQTEDVFYTGLILHKSKGKLHKYQSLHGVLRFESALGLKRLELYYQDFKDQNHANLDSIIPHTLITFTNVLGLHLDRTIRPGVFPFQLLTTDKTYHFATKTKEEQQEWLNRMNTLIFGPPLPEQIYEFRVMVFTTYNHDNSTIRGDYMMRINDRDVILISGGSLESLKIPLQSITKAQHSILTNYSMKFAPLSDNKSAIKIVAIQTTKECDLGPGTYVFAAISAPEIVKVIDSRKLKVRRLPSIPPHPSPPQAQKMDDNDGFLTHAEVTQIIGKKSKTLSYDKKPKRRYKSTSPSDLTPTKTKGRARSVKYSWDETFSSPKLHEGHESADVNTTLPNRSIPSPGIPSNKEAKRNNQQQFFSNLLQPGRRSSEIYLKSKSMVDVSDRRNHNHRRSRTRPSSPLTQKSKNSVSECHPKLMFHASTSNQDTSKMRRSLSPNHSRSASAIDDRNKADVPSLRLHSLSIEMKKSPPQVPRNRIYQEHNPEATYENIVPSTEVTTTRISTGSDGSDASPTVKNKTDPTYVNLQCLICSKAHNWDEEKSTSRCHGTHRQYTSGVSETGVQYSHHHHQSKNVLRKTHSLEKILDPEEQTSMNILMESETGFDSTSNRFVRNRCCSLDMSLSSNTFKELLQHKQEASSSSESSTPSPPHLQLLPGKSYIKFLTPQKSFSEPSSPERIGVTMPQQPDHYEQIMDDGIYERIPNLRREEILAKYPMHGRSFSDSMTFHMDTAEPGELVMDDYYEKIRNSGLYERVPNCDVSGYLSNSDNENTKDSGTYEKVPHFNMSEYLLSRDNEDSGTYERVPHFDTSEYLPSRDNKTTEGSDTYERVPHFNMSQYLPSKDNKNTEDSDTYERVPHFNMSEYLPSKDNKNIEDSDTYERVPHLDFSLKQLGTIDGHYERVPNFDISELKNLETKESSTTELSPSHVAKEIKTAPTTLELPSNTSTQEDTEEVVYRKDHKLNVRSRKKKSQAIYDDFPVLAHNGQMSHSQTNRPQIADSKCKSSPSSSSNQVFQTLEPLKKNHNSLEKLFSSQQQRENFISMSNSSKSKSMPRSIGNTVKPKKYSPPTVLSRNNESAPYLEDQDTTTNSELWNDTPMVLPYAILWINR